jgi:hypothetical protein
MNFHWDTDAEKIKYTFKMKSNEDLFPHFGYCNNEDKTIKLRNDMPESMLKFVLAYNVLHIGFNYQTGTKFEVLLEEVSSLLSALISHPIGGVRTIFSILRPSRIKAYLVKFRARKNI